MTESEIILEARHLAKEFSGFFAVNDLSLKVRRGSVHALIGPNGAGKTTVFNLLTKVLTPSSGCILYRDKDVTRLRPSAIARHGIVRSFQISSVFPELTAVENVRVGLQRRLGLSYHFWQSQRVLNHLNDRVEELLTEVGISEFGHLAAHELPYGRRRALEIATTLALDPELLLLDEPMAGLGREDIGRISELIRRVASERTIIMVEHNLSVVADLSDTITVLARGEILAEGDYQSVASDPRVVEAYLGGGHA